MSIGTAEPARGNFSADARRARAFVAARRHSALVRVLRVALIVGAVGAILVLIALGLFRTFGSALGRLSIGGVAIDGTKIVMDKPRLTGARQGGDGYVITAAKAIQDVAHPTEVELVEIQGDIGAADHDTLHLSATSGHYDTEHERLELGGVVRFANSRYTVDLKSAHIDFKSGAYTTSDPVTALIGEGNSIVADSASVRDNASVITFEGHVRSIFRAPGAAEPTKESDP
jgi:lipopolysaccharide export system protein LptC